VKIKIIVFLFLGLFLISCNHTTDSIVEKSDDYIFVNKRQLLTIYPVQGSDTYNYGKNNVYIEGAGELSYPNGWSILKIDKCARREFWITVRGNNNDEYLYHYLYLGMNGTTESVIRVK